MRSVALDLLIRRDSTEYYLGEFSIVKWPVRDPPRHALVETKHTHTPPPLRPPVYIPNHLQWVLHNRNRKMRPIIDQSRNIIFGHLGQLLLENALQPGEDNKAIPVPIIIDHSKLDISSTLF